MGVKSSLSVLYARQQLKKRERWLENPLGVQLFWRDYILHKAKQTAFGIQHSFDRIESYDSWKQKIPVRDYEGLKSFFDRMAQGEKDVFWPGKPLYLAKTSGTTSGTKFIPLTTRSMPFHIRSAKMALLSYINETSNTEFVDGKMLFLQGSPELTDHHGLKVGRLSGITAHHIPAYLQSNRVPSKSVNLIDDWEEKVEAIVQETCTQDLRLISGIPAWIQMYFERLLEHTGKKTVREVFPNFSLMVHGGVNYRPYAQRFKELIGAEVPSIELYPASEGFIAYQDSQDSDGLLLELDSGMFYEFIPVSEFNSANPKRIWLNEVEIGVNYVLVISSVAGLFAYNIGDTIKFVSTEPHRIVVTGRIKHFTSAFGEHVIAEEVERAMIQANESQNIQIQEFHVAPQVHPAEGLPYHEWFLECENEIPDKPRLEAELNTFMILQNTYYRDLIEGKVLKPLVITELKKGAFNAMMEKRGKLGGQNKVPRLANDRAIAEELVEYKKNPLS